MAANNVSETYANNLEYLNQANMRYLNPSLIFFGKISTLNTTGFRTEEETAEDRGAAPLVTVARPQDDD